MKNKLLILLKNSSDYISGEFIGNELGVSRAAIWKGIKALREEGYEIEAITKKGYKLISSGDLLNAGDISTELKTKYIGSEIKVMDLVDSTNNVLRNLAYDGAKEGTVVIAHEQSSGKGRRGKAWSSPKNTGLWMSILLKPDIEPTHATRITLVCGVGVCMALRSLGFDASIKWPNDIIINNKKVSGMLTEMSAQIEGVDFVIVGIGVNVSTENFPEELKDIAISLKQVDGIGEKRYRVAASILNEIEKYYEIYKEKGFLGIQKIYEDNCITVGREVNVIGLESFKGQAVAINDDGELIVEKENKEKVVVFSGEVSVRGVL